jgi:ligand-binding SRPBCC domain-containing protein
MKRLEFATIIKGTVSEVWDFFSSPANLGKITPPDMDFKILTPLPDTMYEGMMIAYKVSPFPWLRVKWLTEITQIANKKFFIDEQRVGPYKIWHHEHHFLVIPEGILMTDILYYQLPYGFLGDLMDKLVVHRRIKSIFRFREQVIQKFFQTHVL